MTLEAGVYRLTQDVANPGVDRRNKSDWYKQPTFKAGTLFVVFQQPYGRVVEELEGKFYNEIKPVSQGLRVSEHGDRGKEIFGVLVPHLQLLKPQDYTVGLLLKVVDESACIRDNGRRQTMTFRKAKMLGLE